MLFLNQVKKGILVEKLSSKYTHTHTHIYKQKGQGVKQRKYESYIKNSSEIFRDIPLSILQML